MEQILRIKSNNIMKASIWLFILGLVTLALIATPSLADEQSDNEKIIQTSGTGNVKVAPDLADITFSVITKNPDVKAAQKENARKMEIIIASLKDTSKGAISPENIQTTSYSVSETYLDDALKAKYGDKVVYEVSNTIEIETSDINSVGDIIDYAIKNGANEVSSLTFTLSKEKNLEIRKQALDIAVQKAKSDAEVVAESLGINAGPVYSVDIDASNTNPSYYNEMYSMKNADSTGYTPIEAGTVEVTATVSVSFTIV